MCVVQGFNIIFINLKFLSLTNNYKKKLLKINNNKFGGKND